MQCTGDADRRDLSGVGDLRRYAHVRGWNFAKANVSSSCKQIFVGRLCAYPAQECNRSEY